MSEEEKKAIENLDELLGLTVNAYNDESNDESVKKLYGKYVDVYETILNLIDKLQKENEELKEKNKTLELTNTLRSYCKIDELANAYQANSISKDKIREKIKELEEYIVKTEEETCGRCITIGEDMTIRYLKELLEEE